MSKTVTGWSGNLQVIDLRMSVPKEKYIYYLKSFDLHDLPGNAWSFSLSPGGEEGNRKQGHRLQAIKV